METLSNSAKSFLIKHLSSEEISNPIKVIEDFFSADCLLGHKKQLCVWRNFVFNDGYYLDSKNSPSGLLYTYKINIKLIEAFYLLKLARGSMATYENMDQFREEINNEKETWAAYPELLSSREIIYPHEAINEFFGCYGLEEYRELLFEWLEYGISSQGCNEFLSTQDIILLYENLLKLYEVAWLINQRESEGKPKIKEHLSFNAPINKHGYQNNLSLVKTNSSFNSIISFNKMSSLNEFVIAINSALDEIQLIVFLGNHELKHTYYFLVIINENARGADNDLVNRMEERCKTIGKVFIIIHKNGSFTQGINGGNRLYTKSLTSCLTVYKVKNFSFDQPAIEETSLTNKLQAEWVRWGIQGKDFYEGAKIYCQNGKYNLCLFSLHQAVESTLIGIISVVLGYRLKVHSILRMIKLSLIFTDEFDALFADKSNLRMLNMLQGAYVASRYSDTFDATADDANLLLDKVLSLLSIAEKLYLEALDCIL